MSQNGTNLLEQIVNLTLKTAGGMHRFLTQLLRITIMAAALLAGSGAQVFASEINLADPNLTMFQGPREETTAGHSDITSGETNISSEELKPSFDPKLAESLSQNIDQIFSSPKGSTPKAKN